MGVIIDASHRWKELKEPKMAGKSEDMLSLGIAQLGKHLLQKYLLDTENQFSVNINHQRFFEGYEALVKGNLTLQFKHPTGLDMEMDIRVSEENAFEVKIVTQFQNREYVSKILMAEFGAYTKDEVFARIDNFRKKDYGAE